MPKCPTCENVLPTRNGLQTHHAIVHGESLDVRKSITCEWCGSSKKVKPSQAEEQRFCSVECRGEWQSAELSGANSPKWTREKVLCAICGESFSKKKSKIERSERHFCSDDCRAAWWGDYLPSQTPSGPDHPQWTGGLFERRCEVCSTEVRVSQSRAEREKVFCSQDHYGVWLSENNTGESHPNWKEDSVGSRSYRGRWEKKREEALKRDGGCVRCDMTISEHEKKYGFKPHVHHIIPYSTFDDAEEANRLSNLASLCCGCHRHIETVDDIEAFTPSQ